MVDDGINCRGLSAHKIGDNRDSKASVLFKLHAKHNGYIVVGGFFVKFTVLPTYLAWSAFGVGNGVYSVSALNDSIDKYRSNIV